jgi:hypothetical protein
MALAYCDATPDAAKWIIEQYLASPDLPADLHDVIVRLASHAAMTGLWRDKSPPEAIGKEADIIVRTIFA